jgi:hypothetical protein
LRVQNLRVLLWKGRPTQLEGPYELGTDAFDGRFDDRVRIKTELGEPAYFFLLAFNPDGKEQLCWPASPRLPPARQDRLDYPEGVATYFPLNDGVGLQVFVLVAARQPLPAYEAWQVQRPVPVWRKLPPKAGAVWRGDGQPLLLVTRLGDRRGEPVRLQSPEVDTLAELCENLRHAPGIETLAMEAFAVLPAEGEK